MEIQWFPGHMAKTRRLISESLKLVDVVIELVDSRLPLSSRNPEIDSIVGTRPRILVLNKCDISDEAVNLHWLEYFKSRGTAAFLADSRSGNGFSALMPAVDAVLKEKFERDRSRGIQRSRGFRMWESRRLSIALHRDIRQRRATAPVLQPQSNG